MLPRELKAKAQDRAAERGVSLGDLVRDSLAKELEGAESTSRSQDPLFAPPTWEGETPQDLASKHDRYLYGSADVPGGDDPGDEGGEA